MAFQSLFITQWHLAQAPGRVLWMVTIFFFLILGSAGAQSMVVKGKVFDEDGIPLYSASILVKNSASGTITDENGDFTLSVNRGDTLLISYLGYLPAERVIDSLYFFLIRLRLSPINLDGLVVTGYTTQRLKEIAGSVAVVQPRDLIAVPAGQAEQMLQGRVAGLNVITSGLPGGKSNVFLHGIGNFGDVTPLYIIDGIQGDLNQLNPNDIESIQVLKDAGSFAMYGVRGSNGVIVITTKKGKEGKTSVSYDLYLGKQLPLKKGPDLLNPTEMAQLTWLALKNSGQVGSDGNPFHPLYGSGAQPVLPDYLVAGPYRGTQATGSRVNPDLYNLDFSAGELYPIVPANKSGTDWFHEIFKPALSQNHTLTFSGGNEKNKHLFSLAYMDQQGTLINTYLKRITARVNTSFRLKDQIRIGQNLQLASVENPQVPVQQGPNNNIIFRTFTSEPILPVYDIKGGWASFRPGDLSDNLVAESTISKDNRSASWEIFGNAWAELDFLKRFTARSLFGGSYRNHYDYRFDFLGYTGNFGLTNNSFDERSGYGSSWTWTNSVQYGQEFDEKHSIKAFIGIEAIRNYSREVGGRRTGLFSNDPKYRFLNNGQPAGQTNYSLAFESTLFSWISRFDYGYKDKYFLSATLRNDGSSVFGPKTRYGWFPALSAAWRIKEEKWLKETKGLDELKLRASWGITGYYGNTDPYNQFNLYGGSAGDAFYDIFGTSNSVVQGFRATRIGEPATGWQEDQVVNAGFETILWHGKLSVTADWYQKKSKGLLFPLILPDILGGARPPNANVGNIHNEGLDFLVNTRGTFLNMGSWDLSLTGNANKNRIKKLNDLPFFDAAFEQGGLFVRNEVGYPVSSFYGYRVTGFFQNQEDISQSAVQQAAAPGRFKYLDADQNGVINDADRVHFGNANPDFTLGLNLGLSFRNFDFSTFLYGSFGNEIMDVTKGLTDIFAGIPGAAANTAKSKRALYQSWTPQRLNAKSPIAENSFNFSNLGAVNSFLLEDGTYFRNKSLILGYSVPASRLEKWSINKLRVYIQATNLFTLTSYPGLDPELSGFSAAYGLDFGNYPNNQKQYLLGLNILF